MLPNDEYRENLLAKAIDREPMSDEELRDFGSAVIDDPETAREYVLMRDLLADAAELPRAEPSASFVENVMGAVRAAPAYGGEALAPSLWNRAAVGAVAVLVAALTATLSTREGILSAWAKALAWDEWAALAFSGGEGFLGWLTDGWRAVQGSAFLGAGLWLAIGLLPLVFALHWWAVRPAERPHSTGAIQ